MRRDYLKRGFPATWRGAALLPALLAAGAVLVLGLAARKPAEAASPAQSAGEGQTIFEQKCSPCHTIGGGRLVGPDLKDVAQRRELEWMRSFILAPDRVLASGDPIAAQLLAENNNVSMPNLGLSEAEVESLLAFLENPGAAPAPPAPTRPAMVGAAGLGQAIFTGARPLQNGGPSCIACHNVEGAAALGGGSLGPDLTHVLQRYGEAGLASALQGLPFPTMQGPFANRPLTPEEQSGLYAFFLQADGRAARPRSYTGLFWAVGALGAAALFGVMAAFWPRQRQSLAEALRRK